MAKLARQAVVFAYEAFFVFGGFKTNVIARLDAATFAWEKVGELGKNRSSHNAIYLGNVFLVVGGGEEAFNTEKCIYKGNQMTCTEQSPLLREYVYWPELIQVTEDYKERCEYCD